MIFSSVTGIAALGLACGFLVGIVTVILIRRRRAAQRTTVQSTTRFMYSGNLKQTNLLDALQFLELGRREGILHIYVGRRKGYITFVGGQIVDAFFRDVTGKEAVFQMLELDYGDFYFESKVVNQPRVITESMMDIALEWDARRYGDAFGGGDEPPLDAAPVQQETGGTAEDAPPPEDAPVQQEAGGMAEDAPPPDAAPVQQEAGGMAEDAPPVPDDPYQEAPAEPLPAESDAGRQADAADDFSSESMNGRSEEA